MTPEELQARCAFLERELGEVGIQLDAAQKRLRLANDVVESMRLVQRALAAWDAVPGDEGRLHDTEGR